MKYFVSWTSLVTGNKDMSRLMDSESQARAWAEAMNKNYPKLVHRVERTRPITCNLGKMIELYDGHIRQENG